MPTLFVKVREESPQRRRDESVRDNPRRAASRTCGRSSRHGSRLGKFSSANVVAAPAHAVHTSTSKLAKGFAMSVGFFGLGMMEVVMLMFMGGINPGLLPSSLPPLPEDKALVSAAPEECLLYAGWYGAAEPKGGGKNRVESLLAEPEVRHFATTLWKELHEAMRRDAFHFGPRDSAMVAENVLPLVEIGLTRPGAIYLSKLEFKGGDFGAIAVDAKAGLIVNAGPRAEDLRRIIAKFEEMVPERLRDEIKTVEVNDVKFKQIPMPPNAPQIMYGYRGDYFIIAVGEGSAEKIVTGLKDARGAPKLAQADSRTPAGRAAGGGLVRESQGRDRRGQVVRRSGGGDGARATMMARVLEVTGLDGVESVSSVAGLGETDHVTKSLVTISGKPRGLLNLISDKPLTADDLASVPRDATWLMASRFDLAKAYKQVVEMVGEFNPRLQGSTRRPVGRAGEAARFSPRERSARAAGRHAGDLQLAGRRGHVLRRHGSHQSSQSREADESQRRAAQDVGRRGGRSPATQRPLLQVQRTHRVRHGCRPAPRGRHLVPDGQAARRRPLPAERESVLVPQERRLVGRIAGRQSPAGAKADQLDVPRHAGVRSHALSLRADVRPDGHPSDAPGGHEGRCVAAPLGGLDLPAPAAERQRSHPPRRRHLLREPAIAPRYGRRDRRLADGGLVARAGRGEGPHGGQRRAVDEQPQADRPGDAQLPRLRTARFPRRPATTATASRS